MALAVSGPHSIRNNQHGFPMPPMPESPTPENNLTPSTGDGGQFAPTSWTDVLAAQRGGSPEASAALEKLCGTYWYPLYAYLRRKGFDPHKAQDLNQEFFYRLLRENYLGAVDRRRGKFRSFLLAALNHFVSNQRDHERAAKRGGGKTIISLDDTDAENRFKMEPSSNLSPEKIFERNWFLTLFDQALARMNMTPNAVAVTVHRWRERYKKLVQEEIVRTVADPSEIEDELHRFFAVLEG